MSPPLLSTPEMIDECITRIVPAPLIVFIALATFVIVKFLRFPMLKYINSAKRKRIARTASTVALLVFSGSIYLFFNLSGQKYWKGMKINTDRGFYFHIPVSSTFQDYS